VKINRIELKRLQMPLVSPFETSFGSMIEKDFFLVCAHGDREVGYGESTAMPTPFYNEETTETVGYMLREYLIPLLCSSTIQKPEDLEKVFAGIRRHHMAKAALEGAIWDLYCKQQGISLAKALGGEKEEIAVGVSIGIQPTIQDLITKVESYVEQGYQKIKVKIKPGWDIEPIRAIREHFGDQIPLMADANSAYTLADVERLKELDPFGLLMIEQPLAHDDIIDHAKLQRELETPICLDESIHSAEDTRKAIELGSCKIINIKIGRVGGLTEAKRIHDVCQSHHIPVWCGGMLEAGVGRAHNIAITSLSNFTIPGDTSASDRYWKRDIVKPQIQLIRPGFLAVPKGPGIGYDLDWDAIDLYTIGSESFEL
jgi:o-succinylbenzoate synthase